MSSRPAEDVQPACPERQHRTTVSSWAAGQPQSWAGWAAVACGAPAGVVLGNAIAGEPLSLVYTMVLLAVAVPVGATVYKLLGDWRRRA